MLTPDTSFGRQRRIFERTLTQIRERGYKVVTIHSRRAAREVVELLERYPPRSDIVYILHWFTGSLSAAKRAIDLGCFFSVNVNMLRTLEGARLAEKVPSSRLLTETDGPFGSVHGKISKPADVLVAIDELARLRATGVDQMREELRANSTSLFT